MHRPSKASIDGSEYSVSSSQSKSIDSSEELSSTLSSPGLEVKQSGSGSLSSARSSVTDSPGSQTSEFFLKTLGCLTDLEGLADGPLEVINAIDCAQQEEELPFIAKGDDVYLSLSVHGIKITTSNQMNVIQRMPLYMIERLVTFDDGIAGNTILAIKTVIRKLYGEDDYVIYAYQCPSKEVGQKITNVFRHILSKVISAPSKLYEGSQG